MAAYCLTLGLADVRLLSHALNNCRLIHFSEEQRDQLPDLGRKLAQYLAEQGPSKRAYNKKQAAQPFHNPERAAKAGIFAALRGADDEFMP